MNPRARNRVVTGALILLILLVVVGAALGLGAPVRADEAFRTTTGAPQSMATDLVRGRYWVLEKPAGRLTLTALNAQGAVEGTMNSRDQVTNARGLAFVDGQAYVGDIGGQRAEVSVYQVTEPWPETEILKAIRYRLTYPDGPHDASTLLVGPDHRVRIVTTGAHPGVYEAPAEPSKDAASALVRVADAPEGITDGTVLEDGRVVLRTADRLVVLASGTWARVADAPIAVAEQGAVVAPSLGTNEIVTALGEGGLVSRWTVPGPAPTATPTPRATRLPDGGSQASETPDRPLVQPGTLVALGAAAGLALACAAVVLLRRR